MASGESGRRELVAISNNYGSVSDDAPQRRERTVFPLEPFRLLCPEVQICLPPTWTKIQSWPHLVLIVGTLLNIILLVQSAVRLQAASGARGRHPLSYGVQLLPALFSFCSLFYFIRTIKQYDDELLSKQEKIHKAVREKNRQNNLLLKELQDQVDRSMGTQASLAENSFDSSRRDFQRFLASQHERLESAAEDGEKGERLGNAFESFVGKWLNVFSECSVDPVSKPRHVVSMEELAECQSRADAAQLVGRRLLTSRVKFISGRVEEDRIKISTLKRSWGLISAVHRRAMKMRKTVASTEQDVESCGFARSRSMTADEELAEYRWVRFGRRRDRESQQRGIEEVQAGNFPIELNCGFLSVMLLSMEHCQLILGFFFGCLVVALELLERENAQVSLICEVCICLVCIAFVLHDFLNIDVVMHLEAQLHEAESAQLAVEARRERMMRFYGEVQKMTDFWLYRTVPRLELFKLFHDDLRDQEGQLQYTKLLERMNKELASLEDSLPSLALWIDCPAFSGERKRQIGSIIVDLTRARNAEEAMSKVPEAVRQISVFRERLETKARALNNPSITLS